MKLIKSSEGKIVDGKTYVKRIIMPHVPKAVNILEEAIVAPHSEIPLHRHKYTEELFYFVSGEAVAIVDEFGNSSRSKEAPFKIE